MARWVRLSRGWLDLDKVGYVADAPRGLALYPGISPTGAVHHVPEEDAEVLRRHLTQLSRDPGMGAEPQPAQVVGVNRAADGRDWGRTQATERAARSTTEEIEERG